MSTTGLEVFDRTVQKTNSWLNDLSQILQWDDKHKVYLALRATLHALRDRLTVEFERAGLTWHPYVNVVVSDGAVHLWGIVSSQGEAEALRLAAERVPGVTRVESHLAVHPRMHAV